MNVILTLFFELFIVLPIAIVLWLLACLVSLLALPFWVWDFCVWLADDEDAYKEVGSARKDSSDG